MNIIHELFKKIHELFMIISQGWFRSSWGHNKEKVIFTFVYMGNIGQVDSGERCGPWASCFSGL
jgi:hypothetical protein